MESRDDSGAVAGGVIGAKLDKLADLLGSQSAGQLARFNQAMAGQAMLGEQLREAIEASGLTAYRIAKAAGIRPEMISRFLNRERDLTLESAGKVAAALRLELRPESSRKGR